MDTVYNKGALPKLRKRRMDQKCGKREYSGCLGLFKHMSISVFLVDLFSSPFSVHFLLLSLLPGRGYR